MGKGFNYGQLMQKAMHQMIAGVLAQVARDGLPGDHHFVITFDTTHPGVDIPDWLRERYPEEMRIVMQNWFENLAVMKDRFTVTLSFGGEPYPIVVPFDAIRMFADPSVAFGLGFKETDRDGPPSDDDRDPPKPPSGPIGGPETPGVVSLDRFRNSRH